MTAAGQPIASMTGAGLAAGSTELGEVVVEVRSVNARNLAIKQRLCPECAGLEPLIEKRVRSRLVRGTVTVVIDRDRSQTGPLAQDVGILRASLDRLRELGRQLGLEDDLTLRDLLSLPVVAAVPRDAGAPPDGVVRLLDQALEQLETHRRTDGAATIVAVSEQLDELDRLVQDASLRAPSVAADYRQKLLDRVNEFLATQARQLTDADVVREVAMYADRVDVSEELQRLVAHAAELRALLAQGGPVGRKMEFLLQEILRETNTLGSKSPDVAMAHAVVALKSCIDKLREQAANLE